MDFISHVKSCAVEAFNQANPEILIREDDVYILFGLAKLFRIGRLL